MVVSVAKDVDVRACVLMRAVGSVLLMWESALVVCVVRNACRPTKVLLPAQKQSPGHRERKAVAVRTTTLHKEEEGDNEEEPQRHRRQRQ